MLLVIPPTVPVKVGLLMGAFNPKALLTSAEFAFRAKPGTVGDEAVPHVAFFIGARRAAGMHPGKDVII
jgi:hypothetical protein